jgi:hypothetical protein
LDATPSPYELAPGLWHWTSPHPDWTAKSGGVGGWERDVGSWLLESDDGVVLIDPLVPADSPVLRWLDDRVAGRTADVLITVFWHLRSAASMRDRYGATVWGNAKTREELEDVITGVIVDGATLPGGIVAYTPIPNEAGEDETALWLPRQRALAVGDILINTPVGLKAWWPQGTEAHAAAYRDRFQPAVRRLLELPIELILVSHGPPVTGDGRAALEHALDAPTWHRQAG